MAQQVIGLGIVADDKTGDPIRGAFAKANANFTELYGGLDAAVNVDQYLAAAEADADRAEAAAASVTGALGTRATVNDRLSQFLTPYGMPRVAVHAAHRLRRTHAKLRRMTAGDTAVEFHGLFAGDSWTYTATRFMTNLQSRLLAMTVLGGGAIVDGGAGFVGLAHGAGNIRNTVYKVGPAQPDFPTASQGPLPRTGDTHWNEDSGGYAGIAAPGLCRETASTAGALKTVSGPDASMITTALHFWIGSADGVVRHRWNGGAWQTSFNVQGTGLQWASVATGKPSSGTWLLEIELVSGTWNPVACHFARGTGLLMSEMAMSGTTTLNWSGTQSPYIWSADDVTRYNAGIAALAPDLISIMLLTNDRSGNITPAAYATALETIVSRFRAAMPASTSPGVDIMIVVPMQTTEVGKIYTQPEYARAAEYIADQYDCCLVDLQPVLGTAGTYDAWMEADLRHPGPLANALIEQTMFDAMTRGY